MPSIKQTFYGILRQFSSTNAESPSANEDGRTFFGASSQHESGGAGDGVPQNYFYGDALTPASRDHHQNFSNVTIEGRRTTPGGHRNAAAAMMITNGVYDGDDPQNREDDDPGGSAVHENQSFINRYLSGLFKKRSQPEIYFGKTGVDLPLLRLQSLKSAPILAAYSGPDGGLIKVPPVRKRPLAKIANLDDELNLSFDADCLTSESAFSSLVNLAAAGGDPDEVDHCLLDSAGCSPAHSPTMIGIDGGATYPIGKSPSESSIRYTLSGQNSPDEFIDWETGCSTAYGLSTSLYEVNPFTKVHAGNPVADVFAVLARDNSCILALADGVNWGEKSRLAARCAVRGAVEYLNESLYGPNGQQISSTLDIFHYLLRSFHAGHQLIIQENGALTTLCVVVLCPLKETDQWAACACNVGDSLAFVYSPAYGVRELTLGSHDIQQMRDMRDAGGALGPVDGVNPELHNMTCSMTVVDPGDMVFITSDGVSDNFDPVVGKFCLIKSPGDNKGPPVTDKGQINSDKGSNSTADRGQQGQHHQTMSHQGQLPQRPTVQPPPPPPKANPNHRYSDGKILNDDVIRARSELLDKRRYSHGGAALLLTENISCKKGNDSSAGAATKKCSTLDSPVDTRKEIHLPMVEAYQRHELMLLRMEDLLRYGVTMGDPGVRTARDLCEHLINFATQLTMAKRRILEDPDLYRNDRSAAAAMMKINHQSTSSNDNNDTVVASTGKSSYDSPSTSASGAQHAHAIRSDQRQRRRMVRQKIAEMPGKLDHATVVAYHVRTADTRDIVGDDDAAKISLAPVVLQNDAAAGLAAAAACDECIIADNNQTLNEDDEEWLLNLFFDTEWAKSTSCNSGFSSSLAEDIVDANAHSKDNIVDTGSKTVADKIGTIIKDIVVGGTTTKSRATKDNVDAAINSNSYVKDIVEPLLLRNGFVSGANEETTKIEASFINKLDVKAEISDIDRQISSKYANLIIARGPTLLNSSLLNRTGKYKKARSADLVSLEDANFFEPGGQKKVTASDTTDDDDVFLTADESSPRPTLFIHNNNNITATTSDLVSKMVTRNQNAVTTRVDPNNSDPERSRSHNKSGGAVHNRHYELIGNNVNNDKMTSADHSDLQKMTIGHSGVIKNHQHLNHSLPNGQVIKILTEKPPKYCAPPPPPPKQDQQNGNGNNGKTRFKKLTSRTWERLAPVVPPLFKRSHKKHARGSPQRHTVAVDKAQWAQMTSGHSLGSGSGSTTTTTAKICRPSTLKNESQPGSPPLTPAEAAGTPLMHPVQGSASSTSASGGLGNNTKNASSALTSPLSPKRPPALPLHLNWSPIRSLKFFKQLTSPRHHSLSSSCSNKDSPLPSPMIHDVVPPPSLATPTPVAPPPFQPITVAQPPQFQPISAALAVAPPPRPPRKHHHRTSHDQPAPRDLKNSSSRDSAPSSFIDDQSPAAARSDWSALGQSEPNTSVATTSQVSSSSSANQEAATSVDSSKIISINVNYCLESLV